MPESNATWPSVFVGECWYCGDQGVSLGGEGVCGQCEPHLADDWREAIEAGQ